MAYFFLSYSRRDADDGYLVSFYEDLRRELSIHADMAIEETGFMDLDQRTGAAWPTTVGDAIGTCRVFVAMYSTSYFNSEICGREWHLFQSRLDRHRDETGETLARILPVWFVPPLSQPPVAEYLHDTRDQFDADYRKYGLRYFMKLKDNESRYQDFLTRFTHQVIDAGKPSPPVRSGANLLAEPNAFAIAVDTQPIAAITRVGGPKRVTFVIAVGTSAQMAAVRDVLDTYGESWDDWRPYHPECPDRVLVRAQGVANTQKMISDSRQADDDLLDVLDTAERNQQPVVLILDRWVLGLERYYKLLGRLDGRQFVNVAILVPGPAEGASVLSTGLTTYELLHACLGNWVDSGPRGFRQGIPTVTEFEDILGEVLIEIRTRIISRAEVVRRVADGRMTRPKLSGPEE